MPDFYEYLSEVILPGVTWGRNLDALNDVLRGGFGTPEAGFRIVWRGHPQARASLGPRDFDAIVEIIRDHGRGGSQSEDGVELELR